MKIIVTSNHHRAIVDDADFRRFGHLKWRAMKPKNGRMYVVRRSGAKEMYYLHRCIMNVTDSKIDVDHKDRNGLNCRKQNLRLCTRSLNNANSIKQKNTTSQFKGVSWFKPAKMWRAYIGYGGKRFWLGYFHDEKQAARTYDAAAKKYFGDFARLNYP